MLPLQAHVSSFPGSFSSFYRLVSFRMMMVLAFDLGRIWAEDHSLDFACYRIYSLSSAARRYSLSFSFMDQGISRFRRLPADGNFASASRIGGG